LPEPSRGLELLADRLDDIDGLLHAEPGRQEIPHARLEVVERVPALGGWQPKGLTTVTRGGPQQVIEQHLRDDRRIAFRKCGDADQLHDGHAQRLDRRQAHGERIRLWGEGRAELLDQPRGRGLFRLSGA
jgi:hypothetical protein